MIYGWAKYGPRVKSGPPRCFVRLKIFKLDQLVFYVKMWLSKVWPDGRETFLKRLANQIICPPLAWLDWSMLVLTFFLQGKSWIHKDIVKVFKNDPKVFQLLQRLNPSPLPKACQSLLHLQKCKLLGADIDHFWGELWSWEWLDT